MPTITHPLPGHAELFVLPPLTKRDHRQATEAFRSESAGRTPESHRQLVTEGIRRFGVTVFAETQAELFSMRVLKPLRATTVGELDKKEVARSFAANKEQLPATLSECRRELKYWNRLGEIRTASTPNYGHYPEIIARVDFVKTIMASLEAQQG